jgi:lysozyme
MDISEAGLNLIQQFEGFVSPAEPDPVGVPTIGWGTTVYSDGRVVRNGDTISHIDAEVELKTACDRIAKTIEENLHLPPQISLNQNQIDALISFTFNVGTAGLLGSTLFKDKSKGDFAEAANEFGKWVHATKPDGTKITLPGLVKRREAEKALFLKVGDEPKPLPPNTSEADAVVKAVGFRDKGSDGNPANIVASFDKDGKAFEIVELPGNRPETLMALLKTYPQLSDFEFAPQGDAAPAGPRKLFNTVLGGLVPSGLAPPAPQTILSVGRAQTDDFPVDEVKTMQRRLVELNYYTGSIDGLFGPQTDRAVKDFQAKYFGPDQADGLVGRLTWGKLFGDATPPAPIVVPKNVQDPTGNFLTLTRSGEFDEFRAEVLTLSNFVDGQFNASLKVRSGLPRNQKFKLKPESTAGSDEPLPQCEYAIKDIVWSRSPGDFAAPAFNSGTGPVFVPLEPTKPKITRRDGFEIHIDWNRYPFSPGAANGRSAPGTAGCIGLLSVADYKILVSWLNADKPGRLIVDWGLS